MSRDIQYIGMDVHKEAVVIAVLNSSGKLVMESIVAVCRIRPATLRYGKMAKQPALDCGHPWG